MTSSSFRWILLVAAIFTAGTVNTVEAAPIEFKEGDRVVFLGNGLLERAQRYGFVETELTRRWPDRSIVFRNLAWSGDTVFGDSWVYSLSHPNHEVRREQVYQVVAQQNPTVIIVAYGAIEAFEGVSGEAKWESGLRRMLGRLGETKSRLVLMTTPSQETAANPHAEEYNQQLAAYMDILRDVADQEEVPLIDLERCVRDYRAQHPGTRLTSNGFHYTERGYRVLARLLGQAMGWNEPDWTASLNAEETRVHSTVATAGDVLQDGDRLTFRMTDKWLPLPLLEEGIVGPDPGRVLSITGLKSGRYTLYTGGVEVLTASEREFAAGVELIRGPAYERAEQLRRAIQEKNRLFFTRWRPENEVYLRGFRQREQGRNTIELPLFDPLIQAQEQEIARLRHPTEDYYHLIPAAPASSRGPAVVPDPDPALELASFELPAGFKVELFAGEPFIANPICMNWDTQGRLWVATSRIYPQLKPGEKANDQIVVLEDTDGDGHADVRTVFADGLLVPTSVIPGDGGVYVANSTELVHLSDTDGDGRADRTRVILSGFGTEDTHQILHAFRWGPSGKLYFNQSVLIHSHVETPTAIKRLAAGGVWEFDPDEQTLEIYTRGMVNPWGNQFDKWGQSFATDGAYDEGINYIWPGAAFYWADGVPRILKGLNPGQPKECGLEIISGRHFPQSWQGRFVTADFRAHRIVTFELSEQDSGYFSVQKEDLIRSDHEAFRPVDLKMGPDGALYVCDWYNPIINHGEVDFRDPRRDHRHGRIWRITAESQPPLANPRLDQAAMPMLLDALKAPEQWTRDMARRELLERPRQLTVKAIEKWIDQLDSSHPEFGHHQLEALWAYETLNAVPQRFLKELLHTGDHRIRAAAVRVLSHIRKSTPDSLSLIEEAVIDDHPRVRLEAVNALRLVGSLPAFQAALQALDHPVDEQIDFALWVTIRELEQIWSPAFLAGEISFGGDPGRVAYVLAASEQKSLLRPLIDRFRQGDLDEQHRARVASLIAAAGAPADLRLLLEGALDDQPTGQRSTLLDLLLTAAEERELAPAGDLAGITALFDAEPAAIALAGNWQLAAAGPALGEIAQDNSRDEQSRRVAILALAKLADYDAAQTLAGLAESDPSHGIRAVAIAGLTTVDLAAAVKLAADALPHLPATEAGLVFDAFLRHGEGSAKLAVGMQDVVLPAEVAAAGVSRAALFGPRSAELVRVLDAAGGARLSRAAMSSNEWSQLLGAVPSRGDPVAGERVFRRETLGCLKCHSIGGAGGKVGPDLMSLGASAPRDYIAESLVHPNRKIKEGYDTSLIILEDGQVLNGMVIGEVGDHFLLRNADNTVVKVLQDKVDEKITQPVSLMPPGLTDPLAEQEFLDLVRFLTEIGKSERFRVPTTETVRSWQTLIATAPVDERSLLAESGRAEWMPAYSEVNGYLPLADLPLVGSVDNRAYAIRFHVEVHRAGEIGWRVEAGKAFRLWVDGSQVTPVEGLVRVNLEAGHHRVVLQIDAATAPDRIRVTRSDTPDSKAQSVFKLN